ATPRHWSARSPAPEHRARRAPPAPSPRRGCAGRGGAPRGLRNRSAWGRLRVGFAFGAGRTTHRTPYGSARRRVRRFRGAPARCSPRPSGQPTGLDSRWRPKVAGGAGASRAPAHAMGTHPASLSRNSNRRSGPMASTEPLTGAAAADGTWVEAADGVRIARAGWTDQAQRVLPADALALVARLHRELAGERNRLLE